MSVGDPNAIPWRELVVPQAINFTIFVALLVYFVRKPLREHFSGKREEFESLKKKAEESRLQAEKHNFEIRKLLKELDDTAATNMVTANKDAQESKAKIVAEAKALAARAAGEAEGMATFELQRAVAELRDELIMKSSSLAETKLKGAATEAVQSKLNDEFLKKAQGAQA